MIEIKNYLSRFLAALGNLVRKASRFRLSLLDFNASQKVGRDAQPEATQSHVQGGSSSGPRQYTVVLRGPSAANFSEDAGIHVTEENPVVGPVRVNLRTRWISVGVQSKMPGHIWLEVSGSASSLDEAAEQFSRSAVVFLPVVAIAANASVDDPEMELAFETTATASERDFLQCHIPDEQGAPRRGRRIDPIATVALLEAIQRSVHRERVLRAVNQYRLSLQSWRFGYESIAVAHLWMAAEALTKAVLRAEIQRRGLTSEADLASALGVDIKVLDSTIRRQIIFAGDTECYENGKGASRLNH